MELLINALLKRGAARDRLEAKLFGGAKMMNALSDIGGQNARFAREFLAREGIPLIGESLGGERARRIQFWPASGRARQLLVAAHEARVVEAPPPPPPPAKIGDVELF
jgi:chemotaxis protein CheD